MKKNEEIQKIIDTLNKQQQEITTFEEIIKNKSDELELLRKEQTNNFDFERTTEIKNLDINISNAKDALRKKVMEFETLKKRKNVKIHNLAQKDREMNIYQDQELKNKKDNLFKSLQTVKESYNEYVTYLHSQWQEYGKLYGYHETLDNRTVNGYRRLETRLWPGTSIESDLRDVLKKCI